MQPKHSPRSPGLSLRSLSLDRFPRADSIIRRATPARTKLPLTILGRISYTCGIFLCAQAQTSATAGLWFALFIAAIIQALACGRKIDRDVKWLRLLLVSGAVFVGAWCGWVAVGLLGAVRVVVIGGAGMLKWKRLWVVLVVAVVMVSWDVGGMFVEKRVGRIVRGGLKDAVRSRVRRGGSVGVKQGQKTIGDDEALGKGRGRRRLLVVEEDEVEKDLLSNDDDDAREKIGEDTVSLGSPKSHKDAQDSSEKQNTKSAPVEKEKAADGNEARKEENGKNLSEKLGRGDNSYSHLKVDSIPHVDKNTKAGEHRRRDDRKLPKAKDGPIIRNDENKTMGKAEVVLDESTLKAGNRTGGLSSESDTTGSGDRSPEVSRWMRTVESVQGILLAALSTILLRWADAGIGSICRENPYTFGRALVLCISCALSCLVTIATSSVSPSSINLVIGCAGVLWYVLPAMCKFYGITRKDRTPPSSLSISEYAVSLATIIVLTGGSKLVGSNSEVFSIETFLSVMLFAIAKGVGVRWSNVTKGDTFFNRLPTIRGRNVGGIRKHISRFFRNAVDFVSHTRSHKPSWQVLTFLVLQATMVSVELAYGIITGSMGFISLSSDNFFCCAALGIGLLAIRQTAQAKTSISFSYGYLRLESLCGFANGILLIFVAVLIVLEALERVLDPYDIESGHIIAVCLVGVCGNLFGLFFFPPESRRENHNVQGIYLHIWANTLAFMGMALSTVISLAFPNVVAFELVIAVPIAVIIAISAIPLLLRSGRLLALNHSRRRHYQLSCTVESLKRIGGVIEVASFRLWNLTPSKSVASLTLLTDEATDGGEIKVKAQEILVGLGVSSSLATIQIKNGAYSPRTKADVDQRLQEVARLDSLYIPAVGRRGTAIAM
eukprot:Plantae.Rhodophyta-Hildenbrandia_rubra.ctg3334.p1 GENE.Plantae.Rhodophyta-Hildenbrandia_rubra.ctg3334~~Plantae.Rhodophyta-Hildenbrandia_rubra.ctg3334.p1  ORF type:complete len:890 (+),score=109.81 Plantae.Rhodophyta-Hildenbrandia_rubra.ctg3334:342-3011(+)